MRHAVAAGQRRIHPRTNDKFASLQSNRPEKCEKFQVRRYNAEKVQCTFLSSYFVQGNSHSLSGDANERIYFFLPLVASGEASNNAKGK